MAGLTEVHERHGATFEERGGRQVVAHYGRPERTHVAVRNGVGLIEDARDVLVVTGIDRVEYVDNVVSNVVPTEDGRGTYSFLLTPQGRISTDMYVYNAGTRLLVFLPPGTGESLATEWQEKTFIQDVEIEEATTDFGLFGVHGPQATEKIASVFSEGTPEDHLTFVRGSMGEEGVTVVRTDAPTGEEGYLVVCNASDSERIFDTLENRGLNAVPFGYRTWETLTLEAGTPLFVTELEDRLPNNLGVTNAMDYEKGCFVGQEVVSRIHNRGNPNKRLVGVTAEAVPDRGASVFDGDRAIGEITRAVESPTLEQPIGFALIEHGEEGGGERDVTVRVAGADRSATTVDLPFVEGSDDSRRRPRY